ncbi:MAG: FtsW/RodA/SpoVE family cell cycle protein [Peptococcaceae bacterium]|jgi:cell division protein FtsW (lipid II flippase)|nr:FtsW/RodA/SpoVE family cell cycle protein [Peptococcaceae bacterium]
MNTLWRDLSLRLMSIAVLFIGLFVLCLQGKADWTFFVMAGIYTGLVLSGCLLEHLFHYQGDRLLLPAIQLITVIGLVFLTRINAALAWKQFIWVSVGLGLFYVILWGLKDYRRLGEIQYLWGLIAVVLLFITLIFGVTSGGARSWLRIGGLGFEPEELVKIALLIFLAVYLENHEKILRIGTVQWGRISVPDWRTFGPFLLMAAFSLGILAAQKSLGTALVFYLLFVMMLYIVTERGFYLAMALPTFLGTGILGYVLFGHVRVRVSAWLNPWQDVTGGGYQIAQSLFAISGGGVLGSGLGNGIGAVQVPAAATDFIFAVIAEELGFAGAVALVGVFLLVIFRAFIISAGAGERLGQILAAGIGVLLATETLMILAGVTKLLPLTGIPLPWVSYGGSSMLIHFLLLGLLVNISAGAAEQKALLGAKGKELGAG